MGHLDGISLYAFAFLNHRFNTLCCSSHSLWLRAYSCSLPRTAHALQHEPSFFDFSSLDGRLFLKYAVIYEKSYYKWSSCSDFKPYCLKVTGIDHRALVASLPKARHHSDPSLLMTHSIVKSPASNYSHENPIIREAEARMIQGGEVDFDFGNWNPASATVSGQLPTGRTASTNTTAVNAVVEFAEGQVQRPGDVAPVRTSNSEISQQPEVEEDIPAHEIIAPETSNLKKSGKLRRSFAKLKSLVGFVQHAAKSLEDNDTQNQNNNKVVSHKQNPKKLINFDCNSVEEYGVDESWFGLIKSELSGFEAYSARKASRKARKLLDNHMPPSKLTRSATIDGSYLERKRSSNTRDHLKPARLTRSSSSSHRKAASGVPIKKLSEIQLIVKVMKIYPTNIRVQSAGSFAVRRLCYFPHGSSPEYVSEIETNRANLASSSIVDILLKSLQTFRKSPVLVARVFVALGNLALHSANAVAIGDRGLPLIMKLLKKHSKRSEVTDYGIFLLQNVADGRVTYKKKLRDLGLINFLIKELNSVMSLLNPKNISNSSAALGSQSNSLPASLSSLRISSTLQSSDGEQRQNSPSSSSSSESDIDDFDAVKSNEEDAQEDAGNINEQAGTAGAQAIHEDTLLNAWVLKRRPSITALIELVPTISGQLCLARRCLDLLCVMGGDYDIIKSDLAIKLIHLVGDAIVILFGYPSKIVSEVMSAAMRCLLVVYEWEFHQRDWSYNSNLVDVLLYEVNASLKANVHLPYLSNTFLVIFSLVWRPSGQGEKRRRLIDLLTGSMKAFTFDDELARAGAAMLGDLAHSFYDLKIYIKDIGGLKILKELNPKIYKDPANLVAILEEFEDHPLRGLVD